MRRYGMLRHTLGELGIEQERVRLQWASAAEGVQLAAAINEMVEQVRKLGPLNWPRNWQENGGRQKAIGELLEEHAEAMEVSA